MKKSAGKVVYSIATTKNGKINWIAQPSTIKQTNERFKHFVKSLHEEVIYVEIREVKNEFSNHNISYSNNIREVLRKVKVDESR